MENSNINKDYINSIINDLKNDDFLKNAVFNFQMKESNYLEIREDIKMFEDAVKVYDKSIDKILNRSINGLVDHLDRFYGVEDKDMLVILKEFINISYKVNYEKTLKLK